MPLIESPASPLVGQLQGVHLFHFEGAPCAQRVRFALSEKGLRRGREVRWNSAEPRTLVAEPGTWTSRHVSLIRKDHLTDEYARIHPYLVVPALVHDGRLHLESMDIVRYLDEALPGPPLVPRDPARAILAEQLVERGKALHVSVRYVSFRWGLRGLGKLEAGEEAALRRLERAGSPERMTEFYQSYNRDEIPESTYREHLAALEDGYAEVERLLAGDGRPYLTGSDFSYADILWSLKVLRIAECGYPFAAQFPTLSRWYARVAARPGFRAGVMQKNRLMSGAFKLKAKLDNLFGRGLAQASRMSPAQA